MAKYDVACIGNPLLDVIIDVDDEFLEKHNMEKGRVHILNKRQSVDMNEALRDFDKTIASGGSAANVAAGVACLGGTAFFTGQVGEDDNGKEYEKLLKKAGVDTKLTTDVQDTGYALTFITPDYERTFAVYLGAAVEFKKDDLDIESIKDCKILHFEGFQFESWNQREAAIEAIKAAKENGALISIDLADSAFLEKNLEALREIVENDADIVIGNEREAEAYTGEENPEEAARILGDMCDIAVVTIGKRGSLIVNGGEMIKIKSFPIDEVNTNGAGDMYDSGILYGLAKGLDIRTSGQIASYAASKVVGVREARLDRSLNEEIQKFIR